jgi:hypothetical protein
MWNISSNFKRGIMVQTKTVCPLLALAMMKMKTASLLSLIPQVKSLSQTVLYTPPPIPGGFLMDSWFLVDSQSIPSIPKCF